MSTPDPRVELLYTYLMAWLVMHYPSLMTSPPENSSGYLFIQMHEGCDWKTILYAQLVRQCVIIKTITSTNIFLISLKALIEKNLGIVLVVTATSPFLLARFGG